MSSNSAPSRIDVAASQLIEFIRAKNLSAGQRLPNEQELTTLLNVSRSTLREAIRQLVARNILVVRQGSGTYVSDQMGVPTDPLGITFIEKGPKLARDLIELRLMIEPPIAAAAAQRITMEQKSKLTSLCNDLIQKLDSEENYVEADTLFHCYIAECSGNSVLQNLMPTITASVHVFIQESKDYFRSRSSYEHRCILDAICRNDPLGAQYAMINHLNVVREYFARQEYTLKFVWDPQYSPESWDS